jgi:hypothetical protein
MVDSRGYDRTLSFGDATISITWTTCYMMFTFGTIGSWITNDWELVERVLDFHPIENKEHAYWFPC